MNTFKINPWLQDGLDRYLTDRVPTGSFLNSVLENDLVGAVMRADPENRANLGQVVLWIREHAPEDAWGSKEKVRAWLGLKK